MRKDNHYFAQRFRRQSGPPRRRPGGGPAYYRQRGPFAGCGFQYLAVLLDILAPVLYGFAMAYLLSPVVNWFERAFFRRKIFEEHQHSYHTAGDRLHRHLKLRHQIVVDPGQGLSVPLRAAGQRGGGRYKRHPFFRAVSGGHPQLGQEGIAQLAGARAKGFLPGQKIDGHHHAQQDIFEGSGDAVRHFQYPGSGVV